MFKFYFDCSEGVTPHVDTHGVDLADAQEAADQAACLVAQMLNERVKGNGRRSICVVVRRQDGTVSYVAHGSIHGHPMSVEADERSAVQASTPQRRTE